MLTEGVSPELVWGLLPRFIGIVYVLQFASVDTLHWSGSRGIRPYQALLARVRTDYPGVRRFFEYPTVLWFVRSDFGLRMLPKLGALCGVLAMYGGPVGYAGLFFAWVLWLSLEPLENQYPWDTVLLEIGFLALFLPRIHPLPALTTTELPLPTVAFAIRWLVMRLMIGFSMSKFAGVRHKDSLYVKNFFVWAPSPSVTGWFAHQLPNSVHKLLHLMMFVVEVFMPMLGLWAGPARLIAYCALTGLMVAVHFSANFGAFNVEYILFCTVLLDVNSSVFDTQLLPLAWPDTAIHALMAVLFLLSLFYLLGNSWSNRTWIHWPDNYAAWTRLDRPFKFVKYILAVSPRRLLRAIAPFRLVNAYGVFPPNVLAPVRPMPVLEGSADGKVWKQYGYKHTATFPTERPSQSAPMGRRFELHCYYAPLGMHTAGLIGSFMPFGSPYDAHARASHTDVLIQGLLRHDPIALDMVGHNPFPDAPPKLIRVAGILMAATSLAEWWQTGTWWRVKRLGLFAPARGKETWPSKLHVPEPETFHPDFHRYRQRAATLRAMVDAHEGGLDPDRAVLVGSDLRPAELDTFWKELIPALRQDFADWGNLHTRASAINARFDVEALHRQERIFERFVWLLRCQLDKHAPHTADQLEVSNFRFHLILQQLLLDGREAFRGYLEQPDDVVGRARRTDDASQLWAFTLLRYEQVMAAVCGFRWSEFPGRLHEAGLPALFEFFPFLSRVTPPGELHCPTFTQLDNGEYEIPGLYPPRSVRATSRGTARDSGLNPPSV